MEQAGEYRIEAPREVVWKMLNDPAVLAQCIDGCQSFEPRSNNSFDAVVRAKVGPVSATFHAELQILEPDPPLSYSITGQMKGGPAGFGRGSAHVSLSEDGEATLLHYTVDGTVGGKLAQVGQRLIEATGRKMADDFFAAFAAQLGPKDQSASATPAKPRRERRPPPDHDTPRPWLGKGVLYWLVIGSTVVTGIACLLLLRH